MIDLVVTGLSANSVPYSEALELQRATHSAVVSGFAPDTVLLFEHDPVYTAGKRTESHERPSDGTPVVDVDRGGKITWHGPGQLVGYPILKLPDPVDVVAYVRWLEHVLIEALEEIGIQGHQIPGRSGVWVDESSKIAAVGIRVASSVTMHGFALNCNNSLAPFQTIIACGLADATTTSITEILGRNVSPAEMAPLITSAILEAPDFLPGMTKTARGMR